MAGHLTSRLLYHGKKEKAAWAEGMSSHEARANILCTEVAGCPPHPVPTCLVLSLSLFLSLQVQHRSPLRLCMPLHLHIA